MHSISGMKPAQISHFVFMGHVIFMYKSPVKILLLEMFKDGFQSMKNMDIRPFEVFKYMTR